METTIMFKCPELTGEFIHILNTQESILDNWIEFDLKNTANALNTDDKGVIYDLQILVDDETEELTLTAYPMFWNEELENYSCLACGLCKCAKDDNQYRWQRSRDSCQFPGEQTAP